MPLSYIWTLTWDNVCLYEPPKTLYDTKTMENLRADMSREAGADLVVY